MSIEGKVAIVTGGSLGIGAGIAKRLAKDGAKVVITARRPGPLQETADLIKQAGGQVLAVPGDVGVREDVEAMFKQVVDTWGTVDIVVADHLVEVERRSVALALAAGMVDDPPAVVDSLPVAAHLRAGASIVTAPGRPLGVRLDDGRLWVLGSARIAQLNSSKVLTVTDAEWDSYPAGTDLSTLRP